MSRIARVLALMAALTLSYAKPAAADDEPTVGVRDAMTVCRIPRRDPSQIVQKLIHDGWIAFKVPLSSNDRNGLAVAAMGFNIPTAGRVNEKTRDPIWREFWAGALNTADIAVGATASDRRIMALRHPAIGSYLLVEIVSDPLDVNVVCSFAISKDEYLKSLRLDVWDAKSTSGKIRVIRSGTAELPFHLSSVSAHALVLVPDPALLKSKLGIEPDVTLVAVTWLQYFIRHVDP